MESKGGGGRRIKSCISMRRIFKVMLLMLAIIMFFPTKVFAATSSLHDLSLGSVITFSGKQWVILDQKPDGTTYVILNSNDGNRVFDPDNTQIFNPADSNNIGYYLNNTFYNSLSQKDLIASHSWDIKFENGSGAQVNVTANIGLLSYAEYNSYRSLFPSGGTGYWWRLRTPYSGNSTLVWSVFTNGNLTYYSASSGGGVRPALYLKSGILVSSTNEVQVGSIPSAPTGLSAATTSTTQVQLTWQANTETDLAGYIIYRDGTQITTVGSDVTSYSDNNLQPGTQYTYGVKTYNTSDISSDMSNTVTVTTPATSQAPSGLSVDNVTETSFTLYWLRRNDADSYKVFLDGTLADEVSQPLLYNPSLDITDLLPGSNHSVTVTAINEWGESAASQPFTITLLPSAPYGLQATNITSNHLDLSWSASNGASNYILIQDGNQIDSTTDTTYQITNLSPNTAYSFQVAALNDAGQSQLSDAVNATTLGEPSSLPTGLSADNITETSFTIYWLRLPDTESYNIYLDGSLLGSITQPLIYNPSYSVNDLQPGTSYTITVTAINQLGESEPSAPLSVILIPDSPINLQASNILPDSLDLNWQPVIGASTYDIYQDEVIIGSTTTTTYHVSDLVSNTEYRFNLAAKNLSGTSQPSDKLVVKTLEFPPASPSGLSAGDIKNSSFTVYWLKQSDAESYNIYLDGSLLGNVTQTLIFNPSYSVTDLQPGTSHIVTVTAVNQLGESSPSQSLTVTTTVSSPILQAIVEGNDINLSWTEGVGNSFEIIVNGEQVTQVTDSPYTLTAEPGTYQIQVIQNYNENQYPSNVVTVKVSALQTVGSLQMSGDIVKNAGLVIAPAGGLLALALALKGSPLLLAAAKAFLLKN